VCECVCVCVLFRQHDAKPLYTICLSRLSGKNLRRWRCALTSTCRVGFELMFRFGQCSARCRRIPGADGTYNVWRNRRRFPSDRRCVKYNNQISRTDVTLYGLAYITCTQSVRIVYIVNVT